MFNINGETWKVIFVSPHHPELRRSDGSFTLGVCDDDKKTIFISANLDSRMVRKVLTHEITHAAMFSYNVDLTFRQEELVAMLIDTYGHEIINLTNNFLS